jgi:excisionase family DNA binding protein
MSSTLPSGESSLPSNSDAAHFHHDRGDDFLSVKEAAAILNVSYGSVLAAVHAGSLAAYRFGPHGGTYRIRRGDLLEYIASARTKQSRCPKAKRPVAPFQKLERERLLQAWRKQGVIADGAEGVAE